MKKIKPPLHVKMKVGELEIEVECEEEQLQNTIHGIIETLAQRTKMLAPLQNGYQNTASNAKTCKEEIQKLWKQAWFSTPKYVNEVHAELVRLGFHYHPSAVSHVLTDLVRDSVLKREGIPRRYRYMQKAVPA